VAPAARATVALALRADRLPDESVPACRQHGALPEGSVMGRAGPAGRRFVRYYRNPVFRALFHALPENRLVRDRHTRLAAAAILSRSARRSRLPDPLNPRVRGSSPWRRTRSDLVLYPFWFAPSGPFTAHVCSMFARELGPSRPGFVTFGRARGRRRPIGLYLCRGWSIPFIEAGSGDPCRCRHAA
jgi:hypothetical protein